ncbi:unnamed protein product [Calypogeia fissa]
MHESEEGTDQLTTGLWEDGSRLWLNWIVEEEGLHDARILIVSHDTLPREWSKIDQMLLKDLGAIEGGPAVSWPLVLVGDFSVGLVMKQICFLASIRARVYPENLLDLREYQFLHRVKGLVFCQCYLCPELEDIVKDSEGPMYKDPAVSQSFSALLQGV